MPRSILHIETLAALFKEELISSCTNGLDGLVQKELTTQLLACIENLPAKCKEVIELYYMENKSIHEIKAIIGMSESTVRSRLSYGLYLLKTQMAKKPKEVRS